jgi:hypothetical protein
MVKARSADDTAQSSSSPMPSWRSHSFTGLEQTGVLGARQIFSRLITVE